jgi:hypothetical protein
LFDREHLDETVRALVDSQTSARSTSDHEASKRRLAEAEQALTRFQDAIAAGVDPLALVEAINRAKAQRDAVRADLAHQPKATVLDAAEVYAMLDSFGDVVAVIEQARPDSLARLYRDLRLEVRYRHAIDGGKAIATIGVANGVSEGDSNTCSSHPCDRQGFMRTTISLGDDQRPAESWPGLTKWILLSSANWVLT